MARIRVITVFDGDWIEPKPQRGHKLVCCDCGLTHRVDFRVVKGRAQFRPFRDDRATAQRRRHR